MRRLHTTLIRAASVHRRASRQYFQTLDLSEGQPKVLAMLTTKEGYLQKDLAQLCRVEPATMTSLLKKMTTSGLIIKESVHVSGGKRAYGIYLTDKGREKAELINDFIVGLEETCFKGFTPDERRQLINLLDRMSENIAEAKGIK